MRDTPEPFLADGSHHTVNHSILMFDIRFVLLAHVPQWNKVSDPKTVRFTGTHPPGAIDCSSLDCYTPLRHPQGSLSSPCSLNLFSAALPASLSHLSCPSFPSPQAPLSKQSVSYPSVSIRAWYEISAQRTQPQPMSGRPVPVPPYATPLSPASHSCLTTDLDT